MSSFFKMFNLSAQKVQRKSASLRKYPGTN